ncbi:MAG: hypothetical protein GVY12_06650 [Bacteroidetes bacterium]|jgi:hypothetical protein|nr:hypothetical protein [Bacteroidota bacterium]
MSIDLTLTLERTTVLRMESIPFAVTLRNVGAEPLTLRDFNPNNRTVTLAAEASDGTQHLGTQISWKKRNGERFHEPRTYSTFELAPDAAKTLRGDALAWLGTLPPGAYELYAAYNSGPNVYAETDRVAITIEPAHPVAYAPAASPIQPAFALTHAAWQHATEEGAHVLYLLTSSPHYPPNFYRNRVVAELDERVQAEPSTAVLESVSTRHVCWLEPDGVLQVGAVSADGDVTPPQRYALALQEGVLLRSPLSDRQGGVHLLVADRERQSIQYVHVPAEGAMQTRTVADGTVDADTYAVMWDRQGQVHLVWKGAFDRRLRYTRFSRDEEGASPTTQEIALDGVPRRIALYQTYDSTTEVYAEHLYVLTEADPPTARWRQWQYVLDPVEAMGSQDLTMAAPEAYRPYAMALTEEHQPVYLFEDEEGMLSVHDAREGRMPLFLEAEEPLTVDMHPALHTTTPFSHKAGSYVAYLRDGAIHFMKAPAP